MKNNNESKQDQTPKTAKAKRQAPVKAAKAGAEAAKPARKAKDDAEPVDRLPATVEELKASKSGLVSYLFLSGKGKDEIAAELRTAFKLPDEQAVKIARRITGRARFFQRASELMAAK
jgi:hypothetical protein